MVYFQMKSCVLCLGAASKHCVVVRKEAILKAILMTITVIGLCAITATVEGGVPMIEALSIHLAAYLTMEMALKQST